MITKAEIQSINYSSNTCVIRLPLFESAGGGEKAIETAIFSNTPGIYNGYKEGDIVWVAFENGQLQNPCVIGKLYLGAEEESKTARGSINCTTLVTENQNSLPLSTKIESDVTGIEVAGAATTYKTLQELVEAVVKLTKQSPQATTTSQPGTTICVGPTSNLYGAGPINHSYTYETTASYYLIKYNNSDILTDENMAMYMYYMSGAKQVPDSQFDDVYKGAFLFTNGEIVYPKKENTTLKLIRAADRSKTGYTTEARVKELIDEYIGGEGDIIDLTTGEQRLFTGATSANISESTVPEYDGYKIESPIDLTGEE